MPRLPGISHADAVRVFRKAGFHIICLLAIPALAAGAEDAEFFEKKVRPLLVERCYECHSAEKIGKGGLRLDTREGWQTGGDTGTALVPGKPEESLLITAIR